MMLSICPQDFNKVLEIAWESKRKMLVRNFELTLHLPTIYICGMIIETNDSLTMFHEPRTTRCVIVGAVPGCHCRPEPSQDVDVVPGLNPELLRDVAVIPSRGSRGYSRAAPGRCYCPWPLRTRGRGPTAEHR